MPDDRFYFVAADGAGAKLTRAQVCALFEDRAHYLFWAWPASEKGGR